MTAATKNYVHDIRDSDGLRALPRTMDQSRRIQDVVTCPLICKSSMGLAMVTYMAPRSPFFSRFDIATPAGAARPDKIRLTSVQRA